MRRWIGEITMMKTLSAIIHKEDAIYVAECPEVGTISQGNTLKRAVENLKEATELYLEEFPIEQGPHPILTTFDVKIIEES